MLPVKFRLRSKKDFSEVFQQGELVSNDVLTLKHKKSKGNELKIGFSVGIKFSKKSSKRNKIKRWMRETIRPLIKDLKTGRQIIFLINSKFPYEQISYSLVRKKTEDLLRKAKLFK